MNTPHLRAFLYDSSHQELDVLTREIFQSWDEGIGVSVIDTNVPQEVIDQSIITIDPDEVINISTGKKYRRELAIFQEKIASVTLTSGTTSKPKAVVHTFESMNASVNALAQELDLEKDDTWLLCLSPRYIAGLAVLARAYILKQDITFINQFNLQSVAEKISVKQPTLISLVPAQLQMLIDAKIKLNNFKAILVGGANISQKLLEKCFDKNYKVHRTYGMTETFGGICIDGILLSNTQARIDNGEIQLNTTSIFSSYRHDFNYTNSKFTADGWFKTNDNGAIDENGILEVKGRVDDIVNSGGIKINPLEIENALSKHIKKQFIIGGVSHDKWGQALSVIFEDSIPTGVSIESIREKLKNDFDKKQLPIQLGTIGEFVKTHTGKIIRKETLEKSVIVEEHK